MHAQVILRGFPGGSDGEEPVCHAGCPGLIPQSRRSPGEENGYWLQYSCLENPMDGGAWWATIHGVTKSWTPLSDWHFHFTFRSFLHQAQPPNHAMPPPQVSIPWPLSQYISCPPIFEFTQDPARGVAKSRTWLSNNKTRHIWAWIKIMIKSNEKKKESSHGYVSKYLCCTS